ncbi:fused MFS/spermidine synthase [Steroidobacter sp. S1-65]|uniref:Polyamine aminopropyltransferase n=1 Tax=Steroidobacter gossypii TaxID=2805490 RepID=A0ABS1WVU4_9GAMM|nr:fused MFS/spermidine synthase [Steroidobacter gossypii]MBM0105088.1 fused MFS/spermidine synthase [Steroidobacter gossypii]
MRSSGWALLWFAAGIFAIAGARADDMKLLHSERSLYREVLVYEAGGVRCICFTRFCRIGRQTCQDVKQPERIVMNYPQMMLASLFVKPEPKSVLIIGLGGGTIPRALREVVPQARIDVVEIDPAVVKVARRFFDLGDTSAVNVIEADGRVQVKRALRQQQRYDIIMLDAFDHEYIPEHLLTREFLQEVKALLAPGGVLAANTFSSSRLYDHESTTYASVFPEFFNLKRENRVIIAANGPLPNEKQLRANSERFEETFDSFGVSTRKLLSLFSRKQDWERDARILTDQYSPANLLNLGQK